MEEVVNCEAWEDEELEIIEGLVQVMEDKKNSRPSCYVDY